VPVPPSVVEINQLSSFPNEWDGNVWIFPGIEATDEVSIEMTSTDGDCGFAPLGPINCSTQCTNYTVQFPQETLDVDCVDFSFSPINLEAIVSPTPSPSSIIRWLDENGVEVMQPFIPVDGIDSTYQFVYEIQDPGCSIQTASMELSFAFPRFIDIQIPDVYICQGMPINTDSIVFPAEGMDWFITWPQDAVVISENGDHTEFTFLDPVDPTHSGDYLIVVTGGTADCPSSDIRSFNVHVDRQNDFSIRCIEGVYPIQFTWDNFGCMVSYDVYVDNVFVTNKTNASFTPLGYPQGTDIKVTIVPISECLCEYDEITITCNTGFCPPQELDLTWRDTSFCFNDIPSVLSNRIEIVGTTVSDDFNFNVEKILGTTLYEKEIALNLNCSYLDTFYVTISEVPLSVLEGYGPLCLDNPNGGVNLMFDPADYEDEVMINSQIYSLSDLESTPFPPNDYFVTLEALNGCQVFSFFIVPPASEPDAMFTGFGSDCFDESNGGVMLDLDLDLFENEVIINGTTYLLSELEMTPFPPDSYDVELVTLDGCDVASNFVVANAPQDFTVNITGDELVLENTSSTYTLNSDIEDFESIDWYIGGELVCTDTKLCDIENFGSGPKTVTISVVISLSADCTKTAELTIEVVELEPPVIFISNIFNPSDASNSAWVVGADIQLELPSVDVYDRWGNLVFSRNDIMLNGEVSLWDGTYNGSNCEVGVYIYTLTYKDLNGEVFTQVGDITLIR